MIRWIPGSTGTTNPLKGSPTAAAKVLMGLGKSAAGRASNMLRKLILMIFCHLTLLALSLMSKAPNCFVTGNCLYPADA